MITSVKNAKIKMVRELLGSKKHREKTRSLVIEGVRFAEESLAANAHPVFCLFSAQISERGQQILDQMRTLSVEMDEVSVDLMDRLSDTKTSQGILLVTAYPEMPLSSRIDSAIVLDQISDPGNMGTILRTAVALGVEAVFLTPGTTDPFAPKVMRAAMGAHFHLPIRTMLPQEIHSFCKKQNGLELSILLSDADCANTIWNEDLTKPVCILIGSEGNGVSADLREVADSCVSIPMSTGMESFNAAISASILLYEMIRQRKTK
jgi:RNA methyltransferase, TrmH family